MSNGRPDTPPRLPDGPVWAALTVWLVVNAVNVLQGFGFISRVRTGTMAINHTLGLVIACLAVPSAIALIAFLRSKTHWLQWIGAVVFLLFVVFMTFVEYMWQVEFRSPPRPPILVPYLLLFFGSILFMGLPMFRRNRDLWLVTLTTSAFLLGSMGYAMVNGMG